MKCLAMVLMGLAPFATLQAAVSNKIEPALLQAVQQAGVSDFAILMQEQADLDAMAAVTPRIEKTRAVVAALKATAARSQKGVLAELSARHVEHRSFWLANAITARGTLADLEALAARGDVAQLLKIDNRLSSVLPVTIARMRELPTGQGRSSKVEAFNVAKALGDTAEPGVKLVNAPAVWAMGFRGQGVVVGDHDIGVKWDHPALKNNYRGWNAATQTATHAYNWRNAFPVDNFCTDAVTPCDSNGHGTHTTGTMVGIDGANQIGVAPEAKWMACRSLYDPVLGVGTVYTYMDCMEWQIAPYPEGDPDAADPAMSPDVISNSWGCLEACAPPILKAANDAIYAAGQVQVVSAGNDGQGTFGGEGGEASCSTLAFPIAVYESSFTVGASTAATANQVPDEMASFSSLGPVLSDGSMRRKPNVTAPGVATRSSWNDGDYDTISGTSMAGPHVAGMVALVLSSEPRLIGRVAEVRRLVELTANPMIGTVETASTCGGTPATTIPNNIFGYGRIDALAAVKARPQLVVAVTAPANVIADNSYVAMLSASQPATGKIDVTNAVVDVSLPAAATFVSASPSPVSNTVSGGKRTLRFQFAKLEPGKSGTAALTLKLNGLGDVTVSSVGEADQVSPVTGSTAKTVATGGTAPTPTPNDVKPSTPLVTAPAPAPLVAPVSEGRFGGAFGSLLLVAMGLGAALRRKALRG